MTAARRARRGAVALTLACGLPASALVLPAGPAGAGTPAPEAGVGAGVGAGAGHAVSAGPAARKPSDPRPHRVLPNWRRQASWGFGRIVRSDWNVRDRTYSSNEDSYLLARNTRARKGKLQIRAKRERMGGRKYTSGYVDTNHKYSVPSYFRAEVRAKVPMEQGMWAAPLWFRPTDGSGGEIDVIETYGRDRHRPLVHQTLHTDYGSSHQQAARESQFRRLGDRSGRRWHRYTVRKTPGKIVMAVDGVRTAVFRAGDPDWFDRYYEAGKRWNLRINLQVGGEWGGRPDATTDWSRGRTTMKIDYVHTWSHR